MLNLWIIVINNRDSTCAYIRVDNEFNNESRKPVSCLTAVISFGILFNHETDCRQSLLKSISRFIL